MNTNSHTTLLHISDSKIDEIIPEGACVFYFWNDGRKAEKGKYNYTVSPANQHIIDSRKSHDEQSIIEVCEWFDCTEKEAYKILCYSADDDFFYDGVGTKIYTNSSEKVQEIQAEAALRNGDDGVLIHFKNKSCNVVAIAMFGQDYMLDFKCSECELNIDVCACFEKRSN